VSNEEVNEEAILPNKAIGLDTVADKGNTIETVNAVLEITDKPNEIPFTIESVLKDFASFSNFLILSMLFGLFSISSIFSDSFDLYLSLEICQS